VIKFAWNGVLMMNEKIDKINGIDICTESFGNEMHPAILLIMGATYSMVYWDDEFCQRLADKGRYVIRYDNRDVGRSVTYPPGESHYTVTDMAADAIGVLDTYHINEVHVVGMSLGGMIAQIMAVKNSKRLLSMTLIASSPIGDYDGRNLPTIDESIFSYHSNGDKVDWSDEESVADYLVTGASLLSGPKHKFDKNRSYKQVLTEIRRADNLLSMFNHTLLTDDGDYDGELKKLIVPILVVHGTKDIVNSYEHGLALANEIPNATLLTLEGTNHEIHFDDWDTIINAILKHTSNN
jgi:pimeloyl-ACP methyl ester carboxylesterase